MKRKIFVINLKGEREPFSFKKVYRSALNSGAQKEKAWAIASQIEREVFPGISTAQIFERIFELLSKKSPQSAIRFNLKKAIEKLGPTGFPFEKFIGRIFEAEGFEVKLNQMIPGYCINFEIDFLAKKENLVYIGECKFRQEPAGRVDLRAALANYARFLDIERGRFLNSNLKYKSIIVTNAKFTQEAIKYSECTKVELLGWKYPKKRGLEFLIEKNQLYPITILPSVNQFLAKELIQQKIILVKDVFKKEFGELRIKNKGKILNEAKILLKNEF